MIRLFVPKEQLVVSSSQLAVQGTDVNYLKNVMRLGPGDEIVCFDGSGTEYLSKIASYEKEKAILEIVTTRKPDIESPIRITLAQGLPKGQKMDDIVRQTTELGVAEIIPVITERSIGKGDKHERWQKIAKEAAEQSGRTSVPTISKVTKFKDFLATGHWLPGSLHIMAWESERTATLRSVLSELAPSPETPASICVLIGPEGGFSQKEAEEAKDAGFIPVSLGKTILRTETAGPSVISMLNYHFWKQK